MIVWTSGASRKFSIGRRVMFWVSAVFTKDTPSLRIPPPLQNDQNEKSVKDTPLQTGIFGGPPKEAHRDFRIPPPSKNFIFSVRIPPFKSPKVV